MTETVKNVENEEAGKEPKKNEPKQVWQIASEIYGIKKRRSKMPGLAEGFGICTKKQYYASLEKPGMTDEEIKEANRQNAIYNQKIGEELLAGKRVEKKDTLAVINQFPVEKQKWLREHENEIDQGYLANLNENDIANINKKINDESSFIGFFRNQKEAILNKRLDVKSKNVGVNDFKEEDIDKAVLYTELLAIDKNLKDFLVKGLGQKAAAELETQAKKNTDAKLSKISDDEVKKSGLSREELGKHIERMELLSLAKEKGLDQKFPSEFDELAINLYKIQKETPLLEKFWNKELLKYIKDKILSMYDRVSDFSGDALDKSKATLMGQDVMKDYLADTEDKNINLEKFIDDDTQRDQKYRNSLREKYQPALEDLLDGVYAANGLADKKDLFDENTGTLKSQDDKKNFSDDQLEKIKSGTDQQFRNVESTMLKNELNPAIKRQAVSTCIDALRSCMNFSLADGEQKTLLQSLESVESNAILEGKDRVVKIYGKIGDKDMTVYYNLTTGAVKIQKFLKKDIVALTHYINDDKRGREEIPGLKLPQLSDFTQKVQNRGPEGRKDLVTESKNIEDMKKNMQKKLDMDVKADHLVDMDPSYFEKVAVQNMFTQEILVDFMKFPKDLKEVGGQHKEYRELLDLVNNAANWYTKDELKRGRETIKDMKDIKEKDITYHPNLKDTQPIKNMQKNNPERYFFEMAFCPYVVDKINYRDKPADNTYLKFFQCFKSPKSDSFPMIDLDKLADYKNKLGKKINKEEDNAMAWKRNQTFETNMESMESQATAENSMEEDLNAAYGEKNVA